MAADPLIRPLDDSPEYAVSPWCHSSGRRILDVALASVLLVLSSPVLAIAAAAVKLTSPGPSLFRQQRIGRHGRPFTLLKLRTMHIGTAGAAITRAGDDRVTPVGRILRRTKIDELPQLVNVVRGDMALVGPRPEIPEYVQRYTSMDRELLNVRPGVTGAASIAFRDEEAVLASVPPDRCASYYTSVLLPHKSRIELAYLNRASLLTDLQLLVRTLAAVVRL